MAGQTLHTIAHESDQTLSTMEEKTLVQWITRLTHTGFPALRVLVVQMAEEIQHGCVQLSKTLALSLQPIGKKWLDRFKTCHLEIARIWTRQIKSAWFKATSYEGVKRWFNVVTELFLQHQYPLERVYNMDESGFAVGASQSSRALVNICKASSWKIVAGQQEWIIAIECVSAAGVVVPPLIIFKVKHMNTAWIPAHTC